MNGPEWVLDSNIIVDFLRGDQRIATFWRDRVRGQKTAVSQITRMELLSVPGLTREAEGEIQRLLQHLQVVGIDSLVENAAVALRRERHLKLPDAIIAATAKVLNCPLVTGDAELARKVDTAIRVLNPYAPVA